VGYFPLPSLLSLSLSFSGRRMSLDENEGERDSEIAFTFEAERHNASPPFNGQFL